MTKELFVCDPHTTNNLMELMAAFQGTRGHGAVQVEITMGGAATAQRWPAAHSKFVAS
ncbi:MAG: hypothetical protein ABI759_01535 [Candidatus Solibacter sp.]